VANPIIQALEKAVRARGADPLITWYDPDSGARTELSVRSFANWVDKTANLLASWEVEGGVVVGEVNRTNPGHWMSLIWPLAAWQAGCTYTVSSDPCAAVVVRGPLNPFALPGQLTVACSLHPLGLGLRDLPAEVLDFSSEALGQSDAHHVRPVQPTDPAWIDATGTRTHAGLLVDPQPGRTLVRPSDSWQTLAAAVIAPLAGGGSAVIVDGTMEPAALARLVATERITTPMA
jgi:uncharacterized protein (TIGR03089 family)